MALLTIFATAKPARGRFGAIQRNALSTWTALADVDVVLIGDDLGARELADAVGARFVDAVRRSPHNVPLLDDLWQIGQREARGDLCVFANADLMFTTDLVTTMTDLSIQLPGPFLAIGQRWDLDLEPDERIDVERNDWEVALRRRAQRDGRLNSPLWVDWFGFRRGQYVQLPPFAVGRPGYDHWLVWHTLDRNIPVVDTTDAVVAVHQHHDYSHGGGHTSVWKGDDAMANHALLVEGRRRMRHIGHATLRLDDTHQLHRARGTKYALSTLHSHIGPLLDRTVRVRRRLGIDADHLQEAVSSVRRIVNRAVSGSAAPAPPTPSRATTHTNRETRPTTNSQR